MRTQIRSGAFALALAGVLASPGLSQAHPSLATNDAPPLEIPVLIDGSIETVQLQPHSVRSGNFQVLLEFGDGQTQIVEPGAPKTLRGAVASQPGSRVTAARREGQVRMRIQLPNSEESYVATWDPRIDAPAVASVPEHVHSGQCGCGAHHGGLDIQPSQTAPAAASGVERFLRLFIDTDNQFFVANNSSYELALDRVEEIVNDTSALYESASDLYVSLTVVLIRMDPGTAYNTNDPNDLLDEVTALWQGLGPNLMAHLITGQSFNNGILGIAWASDNLCTNFARGVTTDDFFQSATHTILAHEMGHNLAEGHCNGAPGCGVMNSSLLFNSSFSSAVGNRIRNLVATKSCVVLMGSPLSLPLQDQSSIANGVDETLWPHRAITEISTGGPSTPAGALRLGKIPVSAHFQPMVASEKLNLGGVQSAAISLTLDWHDFPGSSAPGNPVDHAGVLYCEYLNPNSFGPVWIGFETITRDNDMDEFSVEIELPSGALYDGSRVRLRMESTWDLEFWYIVNFSLTETFSGEFCPPAGNSAFTGGAVLDFDGAQSLNVNDFVLVSEDLPANTFGLFFTSDSLLPGPVSTFDGFLCLNGPTRLGIALANGSVAELPLDFGDLPQNLQFLVGETWHFQQFYRDSGPMSTGGNFSSGLSVTWIP